MGDVIPPEYGVPLSADELKSTIPTSILYGVTPSNEFIPIKIESDGTLDTNATFTGTITIGEIGAPDESTFVYGTTKEQTVGGVYQDTSPTLLSGTQGAVRLTEYRAFHVNLRDSEGDEITSTTVGAKQALDVNITNSISSGAVDKSSFIYGTNTEQPVGGVYQDTSPTLSAGETGVVRLTEYRAFHVNLRDSSGNEVDPATETTATAILADLDKFTFLSNRLLVDGSGVVQPVSGTVTVDQGTSPWVVSGTVTADAGSGNFTVVQSSGSNLHVNVDNFPSDSDAYAQGSITSGQLGPLIQGAVTTLAPSYTTAQTNPLSLTTSGDLRTVAKIEDGSGNSLTSTGGSLNVNITGGVSSEQHTLDSSGDIYTPGTTKGTAVAARVVSSAPSLTATQFSDLTLTTSGRLIVDGSQVTQPVSGTVAATQSGSWTVSLTSESIEIGTVDQGTPNTLANGWPVKITDGTNVLGTNTNPVRIDPTGTTTQPISGTVTSNQGTPNTAANKWPIEIVDSGGVNIATVDATGDLQVDVNNFPATVAVTQSTSPWVSNITQFGNNNVVTGTGASGVGIPRVTVSNDSNILATQSGTWTVQQGTPPWSVSQSGVWSVGRTWTLSSGTDSVSAVQSGTWNLNNITGTVSLPTGASTSANQTNGSQKTQIVDGSGNVVTSQANGSQRALDVGIDVAGVQIDPRQIRALTSSDIVTAVQPTGTNLHVVVDSGTVTANIGTTGGLALDTTVSGLEVAQGSTTSGQKGILGLGAVTTAAPSYTNAQTSPLSLTTSGALRVDGSGATQPVSGTITAVLVPSTGTLTDRSGTTSAVANTSTQIIAANSSRKYLIIQNNNNGASVIWINFGSAATTSQPSFKLISGASFVMEASFVSTQAVFAISSNTSVPFTAKEA